MVKRGVRSWFNLFKNIKMYEIEKTKTILMNDLNIVLRNLRFDLDIDSCMQIKKIYDTGNSNKIQFYTFISDLMLTSSKREVTVSKLFKFVTKNESIKVNANMLKSAFCAEQHPTLKTMNRNSFEVAGEFSDCLTVYTEVLEEPS